ncbi:DUF4920 domain-containing protein [Tenacibaculum geojense]|uniref:DUF4920 domain-containing protein n=1 Tax=Tenacibaculum geojense TaxID=915352 RepID=A0ABW3JTF6_9FLAO
MKKVLCLVLGLGLSLMACKNEKTENNSKENTKTFVSFGAKIDADNAITHKDLSDKFATMNTGDTITVKFTGKVAEVCQKKGCWIKVPLTDEQETFVKFKDYAFFMPFNAAGSDIVLNGKAFKDEISVAQLQHYAKDAGKSAEEIAKITSPKITYSFLADGVLLEAKAEESSTEEND